MKAKSCIVAALACVLALALAGCAAESEPAPVAQNEGGSEAVEQQVEKSADEADKAGEATEADQGEKGGTDDKDADALAQGMTCKYISDYYATFGEALERAEQNGGGTVTLLCDSPVSADGNVPKVEFRTTITVKSAGDEPFKVFRTAADAGPMLQITDGFVTLKNVVFDGTSDAPCDGPIALVSDLGRLTLDDGACLTGNQSVSGASAVSVLGADAYLTLEAGCVIENCSSADGAAIVSDGGNIENNGAAFEGNTGGENPNYLESSAGTFAGDPIDA